MFCKSCFAAWAVFRQKEQKAQGREEDMVLRNDLQLGAENGIMRWDVEEIVTVIPRREEYKDPLMEKPVGSKFQRQCRKVVKEKEW